MSASPTPTPTEGPRHGQVTPDNHGDILLVVAWFLMVVMILATTLRLIIRFTTAHIPGLDDVVVVLAMLTGVGSTVSISLAVNSGLGTKIGKLTQSQISKVEKDVYVTTILYLFTLALTKCSILLLIARLVGIKLHQHLIRGVGALVALWSVAAVFAVAFQCGVPRPWAYISDSGKCFNATTFWDIIGAFDILTDFLLLALPTLIVWNLHMKWQKKLVVVSAFAFRVVLIGAAIARLVLIKKLTESSDPTYDSLAYSIVTQIQTTFSVVVACIPAYKPYMDRAQSGFLNVSLEPRGAAGTYGYGNSFQMQSVKSNGGGKFSKVSKNGGHSSTSNTDDENNKYASKSKSGGNRQPFRPDLANHSAVISSGKIDRDDARSSEDGAGSEKYIIQKTQAWNISYEDDNQQQQQQHHHQQQEHAQHDYPHQRPSHDNPNSDVVHAISSPV